MSTVRKYLVRRGEQQYGPYTLEVLLRYYDQGQILGTDLTWTDGRENWITVAQLSAERVSQGGESPRAAGAQAEAVKPPRRRPRAWVWGATTAAVVAAIVVLVVLFAGPQPEDSLDHARLAYLQRDQVNFDRYVDVTSVLGDGVDQIAGMVMQENNTSGLARLAIEAAIPALKSVYLTSTSQAVDQLIISGNLPQDSQSAHSDPASVLVAGYVSAALHKVAASALSYQGIESKHIAGGIATLAVRVATPLASRPLVLRVRMQKGDGYWRVIAIEDLAGLLRELGGLAAQGAPSSASAVGSPPAPATQADAAPVPEPASQASVAPVPEPATQASAPPVPEPAAGTAATSPDAPVAAPATSAAPAAPAADDDDPIGQGGFISPPDSTGASANP